MLKTTERILEESEEKMLSSKLSALAGSELKMRSLLKKISNFEAAATVIHASQKSIHEDLIAMQDKFLSRETIKQTNAFFDNLGASMAKLTHCFAQLPTKVQEFLNMHDNLTKNLCKKRTFLQEQYNHYLSKFQTLINKQEEETLKLRPSAFISSSGNGQGIKSLQSSVPNEKLTRNSEKLKNSSYKYKDIHLRSAAFAENMLAMRSDIIQSMCKSIAECLNDLKGEILIFPENLGKTNENSNQLTYKFSSDSSFEREQLDKEIAMRSLFRIPTGMELPVIRRPNVKITSDGKVRTDSKENNTSSVDSFPFQSDDPTLIMYLKKLVQQEKNIFDFEDFNNGEATLNLNVSRQNVYEKYDRKNKNMQSQESIERVNSKGTSKHEEDYEDDENAGIAAMKQSPQQLNMIKAASEAIFLSEQERKRKLLQKILENENGGYQNNQGTPKQMPMQSYMGNYNNNKASNLFPTPSSRAESGFNLQNDTPHSNGNCNSQPQLTANKGITSNKLYQNVIPPQYTQVQQKQGNGVLKGDSNNNEGNFSFFMSLPPPNLPGQDHYNPFEEFNTNLQPLQEKAQPKSFPQNNGLKNISASFNNQRNVEKNRQIPSNYSYNNNQFSNQMPQVNSYPRNGIQLNNQHNRQEINNNKNIHNLIKGHSSLSNEEDGDSEVSLNLLDDSDN